ncbi:MAG: High-affinity branched-chain amino acid transport system permease protein LivH [Firmicutes bacterium]|nr:High-affinity branched-chain amino acid transport system permease protein LivH [Bacillota bacterium]
MDTFIILLVNGLADASLIFLMAAGLSIILGMMGVLNFAHGTMFLWGGYTSVWIMARTGNFWLGALGAVAVGALMGLVFERLFIRPAYGKVTAQILITLGLMIVFTDLARLLWGATPLPALRPAVFDGMVALGGVRIAEYRIFLIVIGVLVAIGIHALINRTRIGMVMRAGVQSPEMVRALGIDISKYFTLVFAGGAALAALGGALYVPLVGSVWSGMGMENQILAFIVVVVGGMGSFIGTAAGSLLIGLMGTVVAWFFPPAAVVANVLLMAVVLVWKPAGLFGLEGK